MTNALLLPALAIACLAGCSAPAVSHQVDATLAQGPTVPTEAQGRSALGEPCPEVERAAVEQSDWFSIFESLEALNAAIRKDDAPESVRPIERLPCSGATASCGDWASFAAANAMWHATLVNGRLVVTRATTFGQMRERSLTTRIVGGRVFGILEERDDLCPGKPEEQCRKDWNTDEDLPPDAPRFCESDIRIRCVEGGVSAQVEVLDVATAGVYRIPGLRHLRRWRSQPTDAGRIAVDLDDCHYDF
jgi:hypothetical protein